MSVVSVVRVDSGWSGQSGWSELSQSAVQHVCPSSRATTVIELPVAGMPLAEASVSIGIFHLGREEMDSHVVNL